MSLGSLNTDVLLRIFFFTNVATIISLSRVNQYFRTISLTKHLWISVIRDLGERGLVEALPENLKALSTEELIDEVKRAIFGPRTWSPVSAASPKMLLQFEILCTRRPEDIELLPGGKHILFYVYPQPGGPRGIECWEVRTGLRRWSWSHANYSANHAVFHFRGASKATVAVVCELGSSRSRSRSAHRRIPRTCASRHQSRD
ncbi:hypothetical protein C8R43DRAFT_1006223 [Mycena crocata]|nr:hypothetical protein C8R43DRAFT_1006223 [Mycena crocata]